MSNIKTPKQIDDLYKRSEITLQESTRLENNWNSLSDEEQKKLLKDEWKEKWGNESDIEIQVKILESLHKLNASNNSIKGWVTFLGIIQIIAIIGAILFSIN